MRKILLAIAFACLVFCGCRLDVQDADDTTFTVLTYNVQNLMDAKLDGDEYEEYRPSASWTDDAYRARLRMVARVVTDKTVGRCDVLVFQELEHEGVLADLVNTHLAAKGYRWYALAKREGDPIGVGLVSRIRPDAVFVHSVPGCRPVLEASIPTRFGPVVLFAVHAKSRIGDAATTEALRLEASRTIGEAAALHEDCFVLACGDFNEDPEGPDDAVDGQPAFVLASSSEAGRYRLSGSFCVSGNRDEVCSDIWYSPYLDSGNRFSVKGSCFFGGSWHHFDQFLGTWRLFDNQGWEFDSCRIIAPSYAMNADGAPRSWNRTELLGVSDHYPVLLTLSSSR